MALGSFDPDQDANDWFDNNQSATAWFNFSFFDDELVPGATQTIYAQPCNFQNPGIL